MKIYEDQPSGAISRVRMLRRNATEAEKRLRRALKEALPNLKWRFQVPFGPYAADFLCFSAKLVIEVDGGQHAEAAAYDAARTRFIESEGYRVLRFWNNDVLENTDGVIAMIQNSLSSQERDGAAKPREGKDSPVGQYPSLSSPGLATLGPPLLEGEGQ
jgi:very-short-patch-repair endonuclease